eukprot:14285746-Alexandrium_andersonii.AAC.1
MVMVLAEAAEDATGCQHARCQRQGVPCCAGAGACARARADAARGESPRYPLQGEAQGESP